MAASEPPVVLGYDLEPSPPCPLHYFSPLRSVVHCVSTYRFSFRWQKTYSWLKYTVTGALHTHIVLLLARTGHIMAARLLKRFNVRNVIIPCPVYAINGEPRVTSMMCSSCHPRMHVCSCLF